MRYIRGGDRNQASFLPARIDDYVAADAVVRVIDAFVEGLDMFGLGLVRATPAATATPTAIVAARRAVLLGMTVRGFTPTSLWSLRCRPLGVNAVTAVNRCTGFLSIIPVPGNQKTPNH